MLSAENNAAAMADLISVENLSQILRTDSSASQVLLIDCRPFILFNGSRISDSHNVHCPPIVKRRSGGSLPLENIVRCVVARGRLLAGQFVTAVVYDETESLQDLSKDSTLLLVVRTLREETGISVHFLEGGFPSFERDYPQLLARSTESVGTETPSKFPSLSCGTLQLPDKSVLRNSAKKCTFGLEQSGPVEVLPFLYIGSIHHALREELLRQRGITALLNMAATTDANPPPSFDSHFRSEYIPVRDSCTADILQWFPNAINFIESVREEGGKVLVHCKAGISRSATIIMAYLMFHKDFGLEEAFDYLKAKRTVISPNLNFMRQLSEYESQLKNARGRSRLALRRGSQKDLTLNIASLLESQNEKAMPRAHIKPRLSLAFPQCTQQAFVFDGSYTPPSNGSPTFPMCHSPQMVSSPS